MKSFFSFNPFRVTWDNPFHPLNLTWKNSRLDQNSPNHIGFQQNVNLNKMIEEQKINQIIEWQKSIEQDIDLKNQQEKQMNNSKNMFKKERTSDSENILKKERTSDSENILKKERTSDSENILKKEQINTPNVNILSKISESNVFITFFIILSIIGMIK